MSEVSREIWPVGDETVHAISRIRDEVGELETGNIGRKACMATAAGEQACKQVCQLRGEYELTDEDTTARATIAEAIDTRSCADINLNMKLQELGLRLEEVLMVGVTSDKSNKIGFADRLDEYKDGLTQNPYGWRELPGFNAFFARAGEVGALGRRLADCADINFEFIDRDGQTVFGFEHGTRPNIYGSTQYKFERDGRQMSYTEYVLHEAVEHYGADPASVKIKLGAVIKGESNTFTFIDEAKMRDVLPGWYEDGFVRNIDQPDWRPGQPFSSADTWTADTRGMILRDITEAMNQLGVPLDNFDQTGVIDPAASDGMHSSWLRARTIEGAKDTRDLYITFPRS